MTRAGAGSGCYAGAMDPATHVRLHAIERGTRANGPGVRVALWFQGCSLGCAGCFNPATHVAAGGDLVPIDQLVDEIAAEGGIEGITISGGEPFEQPAALLALVRGIRERAPSLSILVFSGFARAEIERQPLGPDLLGAIDVLVDGRYVERLRVASGLRGSSNQRVHLLTGRHRREEIDRTPVGEVIIGRDGVVRVTGVDPLTGLEVEVPRKG